MRRPHEYAANADAHGGDHCTLIPRQSLLLHDLSNCALRHLRYGRLASVISDDKTTSQIGPLVAILLISLCTRQVIARSTLHRTQLKGHDRTEKINRRNSIPWCVISFPIVIIVFRAACSHFMQVGRRRRLSKMKGTFGEH